MHNYDVCDYCISMDLEMMRVATPHIGIEPCAGPKTDVMGFPHVVVECLLALAQHTSGYGYSTVAVMVVQYPGIPGFRYTATKPKAASAQKNKLRY